MGKTRNSRNDAPQPIDHTAIADLVSRLKAREAAAWRQFVTEASPRLNGFFRGYGFDSHTCQDLIQETLFEVSASLQRDGHPGNLFAWLLGIAAHRAASHLRAALREDGREKKSPRAGVMLVAAHPPGRSPGMDQRAATDAVLSLPDEDRELLRLRHADGLSYRELAALTGDSEPSVRGRLFRLRQRIRYAGRSEDSGEDLPEKIKK